MDSFNQLIQSYENKFIYWIFVLTTYFSDLSYPKEIVGLIIMSIYQFPQMSCMLGYNMLLIDKVYTWEAGLDNLTKIIFPERIKSIICGIGYKIALTYISNKIYVWGRNDLGQLGIDPHVIYQDQPRKLILKFEVQQLVCDSYHTLALSKSGKCYSWGCGTQGELGLGTMCSKYTPHELNLSDVISINRGHRQSFALNIFERCFVWGSNSWGGLGLGHDDVVYSPQEVNLQGVVSVASGVGYTIFLTKCGSMYSCGYNQYGQLGLGSYQNHYIPQQMSLINVKSIFCGSHHTYAITKDDEVYMWGNNGMIKSKCLHFRVCFDKTRCSNVPWKDDSLHNIRSIHFNSDQTFFISGIGKISIRDNYQT